jgi:CBS domain containing-hemolysin-like protein
MTELALLVLALALVAACGAFVAAEFALVTVDRSAVERAAEAGDARARGTRAALRTLSTQLSAAQVGITVTNLAIGVLAEPAIAGLLDGPLEALGVPESAVGGASLTLALVLATAFTMVFGELVPKNLAIARPLATARAVQGFQRGFARGAGVVVRGLNGAANAILRRLGIEPQEELASARSPEELTSLVRRSAEQGTLEAGTATLLQRSLAFGDRRAEDVMTPRGRMRTLAAAEPVSGVLRAARASGHSRFPVLGDGGEIAGVVHIKQAVAVPDARRDGLPVSEVMQAPALVPSSLELDALLETLRRGGLQMALVVDEFGNVDGLVTLEDLIEEIVGEVHDEHDAREAAARREADGSWTLSGLIRPDEVGRAVGVLLPEEEDYETVAGLIAARLGRLPAAGDHVALEADDSQGARQAVTLTVLAMDRLRVDRVRLAHHPLDGDGEAGA